MRPDRRDHPRVCGGALVAIVWLDHALGPSPRVRGSPIPTPISTSWNGTIPACAGEPETGRRDITRPGDHPRVCGGAFAGAMIGAQYLGPSPRVRGSLFLRCDEPDRPGTIPACAGEPGPSSGGSCRAGDHPRVCGGADRALNASDPRAGPSPRVRGSLDVHNIRLGGLGTIPACAGEPSWPGSSSLSTRDHPRVCGGAEAWPDDGPVAAGPSPRVRGSPRSPRPCRWRLGTIPACAGEPTRKDRRRWHAGDHPRVCGGAEHLDRRPALTMGPSPRVRGSHQEGDLKDQGKGTIPACAGEPRDRGARLGEPGTIPACAGEPIQ